MSEEPKRYPLHEAAIQALEKEGSLAYGKEVQWNEFEKACGVKRKDHLDHGWEFRNIYLKFCEALMDRGFKVSVRGMNDTGFRILAREEMAGCVMDEAKRQANKQLLNSVMLSKVPTSGMTAQHVAKIEHASVKSAYLGGITKRVLMMRRLPASPEMARKKASKIDLHDDS